MRKSKRGNLVYRGCRGLTALLTRWMFDYQVIGRENLIEDGPVLIACNHASFLDPPLVGTTFENEIYTMARNSLFRGPVGWLYRQLNSIPIDQNRADITSLKTIIRLLRRGERVLIFPEGERSRDGNLLAAQPGFGLILARTGAPVIPMRLFGTREALPRGAKWISVVRITMVVGKVIRFDDIGESSGRKARNQAIADRVMEAIGEIELPSDRDVYWH